MYKSNLLFALLISAVVFSGCEDQSADFTELSNIPTETELPPESCEVDHTTYLPIGWGSPTPSRFVRRWLERRYPDYQHPAILRDNYFDEVFPDGLTVGCDDGYSLTLTSAAAVRKFLPSWGSSVPLDQNHEDPRWGELRNSLASHLVALTLNIEFDAHLDSFSDPEYCLGDLRMCSGTFANKKVFAMLVTANRVLGGCDTNLTLEEATEMIPKINSNFMAGGLIDRNFICCPEITTESEGEEAI